MKELVLTIDCGSGGMRAIVFDQRGETVLKLSRIYTGYYAKEPGWQEAPAAMFWDNLCAMTTELAQEHPEVMAGLIGMNVAAMRDTTVLVDKHGEAIRDVISWQDRRELKEPVKMPAAIRAALRVAGLTHSVNTLNRATHANWLMVNEPENWRRAHKFVLISTYLVGKLTGRIIDSRAGVAGHLPFDYKRKEWCRRGDIKRAVIPMPKSMEWDLVDPLQKLGTISQAASEATGLPLGLPLIASGTDKGCETIGGGALTPDTASVSMGTQATIEVTCDKYFELAPFIPAFPAIVPTAYNPESRIYCGFWMLSWFLDNFLGEEQQHLSPGEIYTLLDQKLDEIPPGSDGLMLQPYWGSDNLRPETRGAIIGFNESQTKYHIYRAIIEGISYGLREGLEAIETKTGTPVKRLAISGGGSNSDAVARIVADVFGREVYRIQTPDTTGLGGAMATFVGLGVYPDLETAARAMVHKKLIVKPNVQNTALYDELYNSVYEKMYGRLRPLYEILYKKKMGV